MRAVVIRAGELVVEERALPDPAAGEVRVRVRAIGVNRADILQRRGFYPAPPDAPADIPGLELAGEIDAIGPGVRGRSIGERVFGLLGGGAYAEAVVTHERTLAPMPASTAGAAALSFADAAAVPEAFVTAYDAMVSQAGLAAGERVLVHAVGSGVGTAAIQVARAVGATVIGTARSLDKLDRARGLGLDHGIVPTMEGSAVRFAAQVQALGGADVVLDLVGGAYVGESLQALSERGRIVVVGLMAGLSADIDLATLLRKRARLYGTVLQSRPLEDKIALGRTLAVHIAPLIGRGVLRPVVDRTFPLERAAEAHALLEANASFGKVVLTT